MSNNLSLKTMLIFNTAFHNAIDEALGQSVCVVDISHTEIKQQLLKLSGYTNPLALCGDSCQPLIPTISEVMNFDITYDQRFSDLVIVMVPQRKTHNVPLIAYRITDMPTQEK